MTDLKSTSNCHLREAIKSDCDLLYEWVNDQLVRQSAFDTHTISYEEHKAWFDRMMTDSDQIQYILMEGDTPIGQIRLSVEGETAEVDYSISNNARGFGYGHKIIGLIIKRIKNDYPKIKKLIGRIKPSNVASYQCFTRNGFEEAFQQLEFELIDPEEAKTDLKNEQIETGEKSADASVSAPSQPHRGGVKVLFLTNNRNTLDLFEWISDRCRAEIASRRLSAEFLNSIKPDLVISYNYIYMISKECIEAVSGNIINMHISLLPWNRGFSPNIWSFIDNTPKGVTIHMLSEGLDEGDILFQEEAFFDTEIETFETTYATLNEMLGSLLKDNWHLIVNGEYKVLSKKQKGKGSYHTIADLKDLMNKISFEWSDNIAVFLKRLEKIRR